MDSKEHWERIYKTKDLSQVSWFAEHLTLSLELISELRLKKDSAVIDIGGGTSTLADDLLTLGYSDITVLDIAEPALKVSMERLQEKADKVKWIAENILISNLNNRKYDLWHDRAVFHFLTEENDRISYKKKLDNYLVYNGFVIISVFADDGPLKCSGLNVRRHSENDLKTFLGNNYKEVITKRSSHLTPSGAEQKFVTAVYQKV